MVKIIFRNLLIRKFEEKDIDSQYIEWFNNKKNFLYSRHKNKFYSKKILFDYLKAHNQNLNSLFLACIDTKNKKKIATLTIYINRKTKVANVGILIGNNDYKGKGLSVVILNNVFKYIFNKLNLNRIIMGTDIRNKPMIHSCLKLGMKKRNEFFNKDKKIVTFQKSKKNLLYTGVICKDLGAANQILHYISMDKKNYYLLFLKEPSKKLFLDKKFSNQILCNHVSEIYSCCDDVLFGTGSSNFEKKNMLIIQKFNLKIKAVVDHLSDFNNRFQFREKKIIPDKILIFDEIIYKSLNKTRNVIKLPNYYLINIKKEFLKFNTKNKNLLFIGEPFKKIKNRKSIDRIGLKYLVKTLKKFKFLNNMNLVIRLHPKQFMKDYLDYKKIAKKNHPKLNIFLDKNIELYKSIKSAKFVFGLTSYALLISANLKVKTFHCLMQNQKPLPCKNVLSLDKLVFKN